MTRFCERLNHSFPPVFEGIDGGQPLSLVWVGRRGALEVSREVFQVCGISVLACSRWYPFRLFQGLLGGRRLCDVHVRVRAQEGLSWLSGVFGLALQVSHLIVERRGWAHLPLLNLASSRPCRNLQGAS